MKKLLLLFMLVPLTMSANFFDGTVKLTNGTSKTGLIEIPQAGDKTLKFKTEVKAKPETIAIDDVEGFDITSGKNETPTKFVAVYLAKGPLFGDCKVDKK
jgi:hypothetical protein